MNKKHGILIRADTHTVTDVFAVIWNGAEIRKRLLVGSEEIVHRDIRNDSIVIAANGNCSSGVTRSRKDGFELLEETYFGNALIIPDEGRDSPRITPEEIAHRIRFFRTGEKPEVRVLSHHR